MKDKHTGYVPVLLLGTLIGMLVVFPIAGRVQAGSESIYKEIELFTDSLSLIRENYVDEVEAQKLIYGAIKGMALALDPHSQFMEPENYSDMKAETEGEFGGIGIEITIKDNILTIVSPIADTPGSRVGLMADDKITRIDDESTKDITIYEAVKKMRGKPGTKVRLTIYRESVNKILHFDITRDVIHVTSVNHAEMLTEGIGYVQISQFQEKTAEELHDALDTLEKEGMRALIIDLRYNPGGLLDVSVKVASEFLSRGDLVVYTKGRLKGQSMEFHVKHAQDRADYPLVILINRGSASASEIVAGAIQDHQRGILLGNTSFGKGSVQTVIPLQDGAAIKLTTAKYYTPSDRMIHGTGIEPDIKVLMSDEDEMNFIRHRRKILKSMIEKYQKNGEEEDNTTSASVESLDEASEIEDIQNTIADANGDTKADSPKEKTATLVDKQLERAVDLLKGILFYQKQPKTG